MTALVAVALLTACGGKGAPAAAIDSTSSEARRFDEPFDGLVVKEGIDLELRVRPGERLVEVQGSESDQAQVRTEVHGGILHVDAPDARGRSRVVVELEELTAVTKHGYGTVEVSGLLAEELTAEVDTGGVLRLGGTVRSLRLTVEDNARAEAVELAGAEVALRHESSEEVVLGGTVGELVASVRGTGPLQVTGLEGPVRVTVSGGATATLSGPAATLDAAVTGASRLVATELSAREVQVRVADTGTAELAGVAAQLDVRTADAGVVLANALSVESADVLLRGTGRVEINVSKQVTGQVLAGELVLGVPPATLSVDASGDGVVSGAVP